MDTPVSKRDRACLDPDYILRCQSPLVFTSPGGNVSTRGKISRPGVQIDDKLESLVAENDENLHLHSKVSTVSLPAGSKLPPRLRSSFSSQITPLKASNRQHNILFSPSMDLDKMVSSKVLGSRQTLRPPLSSAKKKSKPLEFPEAVAARKEVTLTSQERLYISWFNLVLGQAVEKAGVLTPQIVKFDGVLKRDDLGMLVDTGTTNDSLRTVCSISVLRQRLSQHLEPACQDEIVSTMLQVGKRVDDGKLKMKDGCAVLADVGLRKKAVNVLMCYDIPWLKLGLYIVLGCVKGDAEENDGRWLESMLEKQFFAHAGLAKCYSTNKTVEGLYRNGYHEALGRVILKRLLMLVLVLDRMKCQTSLKDEHGIDGIDGGSVLLFRRDSAIKSSRQALQDILKDAMHGEGDLTAHLSTIGYRLTHVQVPMVDYDFQIRHLRDFQDGIRLCRLAQVILHDTSVVKKIQVPSTLRKRKKHNCEVALESFSRAGVPLVDEHGYSISADSIVDADHDILLALAWNILIHVQIPQLLKREQLVQEIVRIKSKDFESPPDYSSLSLLDLLLKWGKMVCKTYGFELQNLKTSPQIERTLCYLINFYLPTFLPLEAFEVTTSASDFQMLYAITHKMGFLQEVLSCCKKSDMGNTWMEKNAIFLLALLCSKLVCENLQELENSLRSEGEVIQIDLRAHETLTISEATKMKHLHDSAKRVQGFYRGWKKKLAYRNIRLAAGKIQGWWKRIFLRKKMNVAATKIQAIWRSVIEARKESALRRRDAALRLQTSYRRFTYRRQFQKTVASILKIQATWRSFAARRRYLRTKFLVKRMEHWWEAVKRKRTYQEQQAAATVIQVRYRGWIQRKNFRRMVDCAVKIQASWRCFNARRSYTRTTWFVRICQQSRRTVLQYRKYHEQRAAAVVIQAVYRAWKQRKHYKRKMISAVTIQAAWRCYTARKVFALKRYAVGRIQQACRGMMERKVSHAAATTIQAYYKRWDQINRFKLAVFAIRRIQAHWRGCAARRFYASLKACVVDVQQRWRWILKRKQEKITKIQASCRGFLVRRSISRYKEAATVIQRCYRCYGARRVFSSYRKAAIFLQAHYRRRTSQRSYSLFKLAASRIQSCVRRWLAYRRAQIFLLTVAARKIQSGWRKHVQGKKEEARKIANAAYECWKARQKKVESTEISSTGIKTRSSDVFQPALKNLDEAAVAVQSQWRGYLSRKLTVLTLDMEARDVVTKCQQLARISGVWRQACSLYVHTRDLEAATLIQSCYRGWRARVLLRKFICSAITIQAFWKGYSLRKEQSNELYQLRLRIQYAAATVDCNMTLGNRLNEALAMLMSLKSVSSILHICATIDVATRHSKYCCERIAEGGAIEKLVQLIQSTNRSTPHEQVLKHALSILRNLARYPALAKTVLSTPYFLEVVAEQLQMSRNKEEIFSKAVDVLKLALKVSPDDIARRKPLVLRRLEHVSQLLGRKVEAERKGLERFHLGAHSAQKTFAEKKLAEAKSQLQRVASILKFFQTGKNAIKQTQNGNRPRLVRA